MAHFSMLICLPEGKSYQTRNSVLKSAQSAAVPGDWEDCRSGTESCLCFTHGNLHVTYLFRDMGIKVCFFCMCDEWNMNGDIHRYTYIYIYGWNVMTSQFFVIGIMVCLWGIIPKWSCDNRWWQLVSAQWFFSSTVGLLGIVFGYPLYACVHYPVNGNSRILKWRYCTI